MLINLMLAVLCLLWCSCLGTLVVIEGCDSPCVVVSFFLLLLKLLAYCLDSVYEGPIWGCEGLPAKLNLRFSSRFDCSDDLFGAGTFTDSSQGLVK